MSQAVTPSPLRWLRTVWRAVAMVIVIVFAIPFYAVLLALFSPWIVQEMWRDWLGRRRLRREGRWLTWDVARRRLEAGNGMLLVEVGPKGLGGACWVPTDALDSECPLPGVAPDADWFGRVWDAFEAPHVRAWCERQTPVLAARASFVARPRGGWHRCVDPIFIGRARLVDWDYWPNLIRPAKPPDANHMMR